MNKLGYVISDNIIKEKNDFVGYVKDISEADPTKPILYIGYKKAKKVEGYKSILDKKINDKTFWTFKKTESRSDYEIDLEKFYIYIINNILYNILFNYTKQKYIYISKNMIYFQYEDNTYGISLNLLEYMGINQKKILQRIRSNRSNIIIYDNNEKVHKILKEIGYDNRYAVPYLMEKLE